MRRAATTQRATLTQRESTAKARELLLMKKQHNHVLDRHQDRDLTRRIKEDRQRTIDEHRLKRDEILTARRASPPAAAELSQALRSRPVQLIPSPPLAPRGRPVAQ
uniref:Uncharacterized protein n=1 Tax=Haptolina ericina TaxID=156174 RepID=A0A7S3AFB1_9EUKA